MRIVVMSIPFEINLLCSFDRSDLGYWVYLERNSTTDEKENSDNKM